MTTIAEAHDTATVTAARQDARAQGTQRSDYMPYLPASSTPYPPEGVDPSDLVWSETVAPGGYTHKVVARGTRIRLTDLTGDACAHVILFNAAEPWERLNVADTQKIPWQAYLTTGHPLLSGDGRVLASIVADSSAHHDAFCGTTTTLFNQQKYGDAEPQGPSPSGRALFELAAIKHGLAPRDLPPSISFFQGVHVAEDGDLQFVGSAGAGAEVELLAELPLIILIANVPHPLDPRPDYVVGPLRVSAWRSRPTAPTDERYDSTPESHRAYLNTIDYAEAQGL